MGSWQERLFGWVIPLMGQSQDVHTWHHLGLWGMLIFVILHVYAAIWTRGTIRAMMYGTVTRAWAKQHHRGWYRKVTGDNE